MGKSVYQAFIERNAPRVLSAIDRDADSPTYGSCDRDHWHYKIRDFDSAILQQSGLALALLYAVPYEGSPYFGSEHLRRWSEACVLYAVRIQLRDGAFNEYYPNEHGFPPTAFLLFSLCRTCELMRIERDDVRRAIGKTARYLCNTVEKQALNQEMASVAGLYAAYRLLGHEWIAAGCRQKLENLLAGQSDEGWLSEYGGADIGYLSVSLDMLCEYRRMSGDETVNPAIERMVSFLSAFVHPDGTAGGEYGSRNTTYFLPFGVEQAAQMGVPGASGIKRMLYGGDFMASVDDRYLAHYVLHSFLRALQLEQAHPAAAASDDPLPFERGETRYYAEAGLLSFHNGRYSAYAALRKGGAIKVFVGGRERFADCGYRVRMDGRSVAASNWQDPETDAGFDGDTAHASGRMTLVKPKVATPILHMGLRVISFVVGKRIIGLLKKKIILVDKHTDVRFSRVIRFEPDAVVLEDEVRSPQPVRLEAASNMSLRHVASGKFFAGTDLITRPEIVADQARRVRILTRCDVQTGGAARQIEILER